MNEGTLITIFATAIIGAVAGWFVRKFFPGKVEQSQIVNSPLDIKIVEDLEKKFVTTHTCDLAHTETTRRIKALEDNHKALEAKFQEVGQRIEDKGDERARRIYERMDVMGAQLRNEINGQTRELINVIRGQK